QEFLPGSLEKPAVTNPRGPWISSCARNSSFLGIARERGLQRRCARVRSGQHPRTEKFIEAGRDQEARRLFQAHLPKPVLAGESTSAQGGFMRTLSRRRVPRHHLQR